MFCYIAGETAAKNPFLSPIHHNHNNFYHLHLHHYLINKENGNLQRKLSLPHRHLCRLLLAVSANLRVVTYRSHPLQTTYCSSPQMTLPGQWGKPQNQQTSPDQAKAFRKGPQGYNKPVGFVKADA